MLFLQMSRKIKQYNTNYFIFLFENNKRYQNYLDDKKVFLESKFLCRIFSFGKYARV